MYCTYIHTVPVHNSEHGHDGTEVVGLQHCLAGVSPLLRAQLRVSSCKQVFKAFYTGCVAREGIIRTYMANYNYLLLQSTKLITGGHWPFSVHFSNIPTKRINTFKFMEAGQNGQPVQEPYFVLCMYMYIYTYVQPTCTYLLDIMSVRTKLCMVRHNTKMIRNQQNLT